MAWRAKKALAEHGAGAGFYRAFLSACEERKVLRPPPGVCDHLKDARIDTPIDRFSTAQLEAFCAALKRDKSLIFVRLTAPIVAPAKRVAEKDGEPSRKRAARGMPLYSQDKYRQESVVEDPASTRLLSQAVGGLLSGNKNIQTLIVEGIRFHPDGCRHLAKGIKSNRSLSFLSLAGCRIGDIGFDLLFPSLLESSIEAVSLRDNGLTDASGKQFAQIIRTHTARRQELMFMMSLRGGAAGREMEAEALAGGEQRAVQLRRRLERRGLRHLDLSVNRVGDGTASALASALTQDEWVAEINMANNLIGDDGADVLLEALEQGVSLAFLDLTGNLDVTPNTLERIVRRLVKIRRSLGKELSDAVFADAVRRQPDPRKDSPMRQPSPVERQPSPTPIPTPIPTPSPPSQRQPSPPSQRQPSPPSQRQPSPPSQRQPSPQTQEPVLVGEELDAIVGELVQGQKAAMALESMEQRAIQAEADVKALKKALDSSHAKNRKLHGQLKQQREQYETERKQWHTKLAATPRIVKKKRPKKKKKAEKQVVDDARLMDELEQSFLNLSNVVEDIEAQRHHDEQHMALEDDEVKAVVDRLRERWGE